MKQKSECAQSLAETAVAISLIAVIAISSYLYFLSPQAKDNANALAAAMQTDYETDAAVVSFPIGNMVEINHLQLGEGLTPATKKVSGSFAYWETDQHDPNKCFFGIRTPFSWAANIVDGNCPDGPDDEAGIARLIEKLWKSFTSGYTWAELVSMGGDAAAHVLAIIEIAKAYGVTLIP